MEQNLNDKTCIDKDWEALINYVPDTNSNEVANLPINSSKNRYSDILPCKNLFYLPLEHNE